MTKATVPATSRKGFGRIPTYLKRSCKALEEERTRVAEYIRMKEQEVSEHAIGAHHMLHVMCACTILVGIANIPDLHKSMEQRQHRCTCAGDCTCAGAYAHLGPYDSCFVIEMLHYHQICDSLTLAASHSNIVSWAPV